MKVSRKQMAQNRLRILTEASRLFREKGFDAVSVAEVMKAAGLTHGGFYGHFTSKDDLIAQTLAHVLTPDDADAEHTDLAAFLDSYLSSPHCDNAGLGCAIAALAPDVRHQCHEARASMLAGVQAQIDRLAKMLPQMPATKARRNAIGTWSAMVGAMVIARSMDDAELSDEILRETRTWITQKSA